MTVRQVRPSDNIHLDLFTALVEIPGAVFEKVKTGLKRRWGKGQSLSTSTGIMKLALGTVRRLVRYTMHHADPGDVIEMLVRCQDRRVDAPGAAADHYIGQRKDQSPAVQLPESLLDPTPEQIIGRNLNHYVPERTEAFQYLAIPDPPSNLAANNTTHGKVPCDRSQNQCA